MAVKKVTMVQTGSGMLATWAGLAAGDTGTPVSISSYPDRTVQVYGDATSVAVEGSMDNAHWASLTDTSGEVISLNPAANEIALIRENVSYIRPVATGGTSTTVMLLGNTER